MMKTKPINPRNTQTNEVPHPHRSAAVSQTSRSNMRSAILRWFNPCGALRLVPSCGTQLRNAAVLFSILFAAALHAQTTAFTYQGRLQDNGGPANGIYDLRFTIYDSDMDGSLIAGPITNSAVAATNGLFTTTLDFGAGVFDGSDRWLAIGVRTNGDGDFTNLVPRQPITSTPYAVQSLNAATAASASSVSAANITGTMNLSQLPTTVLVTNGASGVNISGTFSGDGEGVTNVNLAKVNSEGAMLFTTNYGHFVRTSSPGVGSFPQSLTTADVNGDGRPDLISANTFDNTLTVLTNNGSGGFVTASSLPVGKLPISVTATDVNGDGHPDLISANNGDRTLTILTNNGSGGFVRASSPGVGAIPASVTAAYVNDDDYRDLVVANTGDDTLTVLTNDGSGGFVTAATLPVGSHPTSVTAARINGDGYMDLIAANHGDNTLTVLTNNGSDGFVTSATLPVGNGPVFVTATPVNGDVYPDLITANLFTNTLTVLTNDWMSGGFTRIFSPVVGSYPESVTAADVNGDGHPDLVSADADANTLTVLFNVPVANFTGNGSGLTGLNAANLTGTIPLAQLPSAVVTNHETDVTLGGTFSGDGSELTNVPGDNLGNHIATQNLQLNGHWLSGDGDSEGIFVSTNGNVGIGTTDATNKLTVAGDVAATTFITTSDRNVKQNFQPVSPTEVLRKVAALPITTWQFKADQSGRHIGPMAQDFYAAFGFGDTSKGIATVDEDGVALAAIQGLNQKLQEELKRRGAENAKLKQQLNQLAQTVKALNQKLNGMAK